MHLKYEKFSQLFKSESQICDNEFSLQKERPIKTLYSIVLICFCFYVTTVKYREKNCVI